MAGASGESSPSRRSAGATATARWQVARGAVEGITPTNWDSAQLQHMVVIADFPMQISYEMSRAPGGRGDVKRCRFDLWEFSKKTPVQKDPSFLRKGDVSKNHQPVKNCTVSSNFSDSSEIFRVLRGGGGGPGGGTGWPRSGRPIV